MKDLTNRYSRQIIYSKIGKKGQGKIDAARVLVVGCGALGSNIANFLARAGVGFLRIVDRDIVELSNLQRQVLFNEEDVKNEMPKARAAAKHISGINSGIKVEAVVADVNKRSVVDLVDGIDLVVDATDNFETRYLLNDICVRENLPWIYGGVIGAYGASMTFVPGGPCLACVFPEQPDSADSPTCHTAGVLNSIPALIAGVQVTEALKIIVGEKPRDTLWHFELWEGRSTAIKVAKKPDCPVCAKGEFRFLEKDAMPWVTSLCGRDAVQITPSEDRGFDLKAVEKKLWSVGKVVNTGYMLKADIEGYSFTIFPDGRVLVHGVDDHGLAKSLCAKYIGS